MNQAAQDKLRALRQRLADLEPYPWEPVEVWIASAKPLIKAHYRDHFEDFVAAAATPSWSCSPLWASGDGYLEPRRDNIAEAEATDRRENYQRATAAKNKILALMDGLLDLPASPAHTEETQHDESEGPSPDQIKILNLVAAHQLANEADISGKRLRAALDDLGFDHSLVGSLVDTFVRPTERIRPNDRYKLLLWGWVFSEHAPRVGSLIGAMLTLLRDKFKKDPDFTHYTWAEVQESLPSRDDAQRYFVREVLEAAQLGTGNENTGWRIPWDIEVVRKLKEPMGFLRHRAQQEDAGRASRAKAQRRRDMGFDPFDESVDPLIEALEELEKFDILDGDPGLNKKVARMLGHDEIHRLRAAVISARLTSSRPALLAHMSAEFVASLPVAPIPGDQVLMDLDALNAAGELADGSFPLAIWLTNAVASAGGRQEEAVFSEALERVRPAGSAPPARATSNKSAGPDPHQPAPIIHHHHGDTHMGDKYNVTTTNSTIGAQAIGKNAHAVGHVTIGASTDTLTKEQHLALLQEIQMALIASQQKLDEIDSRLFDALNQFLRLARNVEVEQKGMSEIQVKMKDTLDEVAAKHFAEGLRPKLLPRTLGVAEALVKSPAMVEVAKKLLGA